MNHIALAEFMRTEPGGTLEAIADRYHTTLLDVVNHLPSRIMLDGSCFDTIWDTVSGWGKVTTLVHTSDVILEFSGALPSGTYSHGYFNLHGHNGLSGHIKAENCCHIALVERKFMMMDTAGMLFFNAAGSAMFKIFLGRDEHYRLLPDQLQAFRQLGKTLSAVPRPDRPA